MNKLPAICFAFLFSSVGFSRTKVAVSNDSFHAYFISPPNAAKPRVWWHWMNGNITKDGIAKDLA